MAIKLSEMEKSESSEIKDWAYDNEFPYDSRGNGASIDKISSYGLCAACRHFEYAATEFRVVKACCSVLEFPLFDNNPIRHCNQYEKRGALTLSQMVNMAYLLESNRKKVGFLDEKP